MRRPPTLGLLHPGRMGTALAAAMRANVALVLWAAEGRSQRSSRHAEWADFVAVPTVADVARRSDVVLVCCPPDAAVLLAGAVAAAGGVELYVDASGSGAREWQTIAALVGADSTVRLDVTGPPPWSAGTTVGRLTGARAADVAALFRGGPLAISDRSS